MLRVCINEGRFPLLKRFIFSERAIDEVADYLQARKRHPAGQEFVTVPGVCRLLCVTKYTYPHVYPCKIFPKF